MLFPINLKDDAFMYGIKVSRVLGCFISTKLAANLFSQVYLDKVFVKGENPPHLVNFIFLAFFINLFINVVFILIVTLLQRFKIQGLEKILFPMIGDYLISALITFLVLYNIADVMTKKKYFLYKDDGLRAIFAFEKIAFTTSSIVAITPIYKFFGI